MHPSQLTSKIMNPYRMPPGTVVLCTKHVSIRSFSAVKLWRRSRLATLGSAEASCSCEGREVEAR